MLSVGEREQMRLIDADALIERIENEYRQWGEEYDAQQILSDIADFPTVQVEPIGKESVSK